MHPEYRPPVYYHDIALLKLRLSTTFSWDLRPACLWDAEIADNVAYQAVGYGATSFGNIH